MVVPALRTFLPWKDNSFFTVEFQNATAIPNKSLVLRIAKQHKKIKSFPKILFLYSWYKQRFEFNRNGFSNKYSTYSCDVDRQIKPQVELQAKNKRQTQIGLFFCEKHSLGLDIYSDYGSFLQ